MKPKSTGEIKETAAKSCGSLIFLSLILVLGTFLIYLPVRTCEFTNYDDQDYVTANAQVKNGLSWAGVKWAFTSGFASNWHPLTWLSHMLDVQLFALNPIGHHFTNVVLHSGATLFLFLAFLRMTGARWPSFFVAAFFAWHPMHVESVAWIAERKDVLSAFFGMLALWFYSRYVTRRKARQKQWAISYCLVILSFALGLLAKPMLVTLPFVFLLLDFWPLRRTDNGWSDLVIEKIPLFLLSVASSIITFLVQQSSGAVRTLNVIPFDSRVLNSLISYWRYLGKLLLPTKLAVFYPMADWVSGWIGLVAGLGLLAIAIVFFLWRKKKPEFLIGWLWFLGTLVPVIGFVQVGAQVMADRYSYIPSIGLFVIIVWAVAGMARSVAAKTVAFFTGCSALIACAFLTVCQIPYWKNTITLFEHALSVREDNFVAHINLGSALMQRNELDEALKHYQRAIELRDDMFEAHYGIGVILEKRGKIEPAIEHYRKATELRPEAAIAHNNLGALLMRVGQTSEAVRELELVIAKDPNYAEAYYNLALIYANTDKARSLACYEEAIRIKPDYADALNNLAVALAGERKFDVAAEKLRTVVHLRPDDAEAHFNLSFVLSKLGQTNEAKEHYDAAFRLNPNLVQKK